VRIADHTKENTTKERLSAAGFVIIKGGRNYVKIGFVMLRQINLSW
jgi:hypothetical protein